MSSDSKRGGLLVETYWNHVLENDFFQIFPQDSIEFTGIDKARVLFTYSKDGRQIDIYWNINHFFAKFMCFWINFLHNTDLYKFTQHAHTYELSGLRVVGHFYYNWPILLNHVTVVEEFLPGESILYVGVYENKLRKIAIELSEDDKQFTIDWDIRYHAADHTRTVNSPKEPLLQIAEYE